jgi:hypothetical protein
LPVFTSLRYVARKSRRLLAPLVVALLGACLPRAARAEASRVVLVLARPTPDQPLEIQLADALRGQLQELHVEVLATRGFSEPVASAARRARRISRAQHAVAVIWLEQLPEKLSVFLYDSREHLYARDLQLAGSAASQSEAIAIILRSAIAALLEGESVSMTEIALPAAAAPPIEAPKAPVEPAATSDRDTYLRVGAGYVGSIFARHTRWQHGAVLTLSASPARSPWFFGLDYSYFPRITLEANGVTTELQRHPFEAFGGMELQLGGAYFNVQAALSADYLVRTTQQVSDGLVPTAASGRWLWAVSTRLGVTVPASRRVSGVLNVGADFLLNPFHQVVAQRNAGNEEVGSPLLARPRLELGLAISLW